MVKLIALIQNNLVLLIFILFLLNIVEIVFIVRQQWRVSKIEKKLHTFFQGSSASDLEGVFYQQIKRLLKLEKNFKSFSEKQRILEKMAGRSLQKIGVVRFNPFKEVGGNQSFVIALLDSKDNGFIISSLYTREGTRVYAKPVKNGLSKYSLSQEEEKAIEKAKSGKGLLV